MKPTAREFQHGGRAYLISKANVGTTMEFRVHCDGTPTSLTSTIDLDLLTDAGAQGTDLISVVVDELERIVRESDDGSEVALEPDRDYGSGSPVSAAPTATPSW